MQSLTEQCPVCRLLKTKLLYPVSNGRLMQCKHCELIFFTPRPTSEELAEFYNTSTYRQAYENSVMAEHSFAQVRYERLRIKISHHAPFLLSTSSKRFLDIGCGTGDLLNVAAQDGWDVTGTEISSTAVEQANDLLKRKIVVGDILSLDMQENSYDLITIYHVIEHLINPIDTLAKLHRLLRPSGVAFIETPNTGGLGARIQGKHWSHIIPPEHITYFKPSSLRYALREAGFQRFEVFTNSPPVISSISRWPQFFQALATNVYRLAPLFNLGAALQAVAFKD